MQRAHIFKTKKQNTLCIFYKLIFYDMKKLSVTNLTPEEKGGLKIIQRHYGIKTKAGAARKAIKEHSKVLTYINKKAKK